MDIELRQACDADTNFVLNSYLRCRRHDRATTLITNAVFFPAEERQFKAVLGRATTVVACAADDPDQIYGWLTYEMAADVAILHFCYVKHPFRRFGIAAKLVAAATSLANASLPVVITHTARAVPPQYLYNPYLRTHT